MLSIKDLAEIINKIHDISKADNVIIIGIAGGSCSGKTFVSNILANNFKGTILSMDDYYRGAEFTKDGNFDKPEALDLELLGKHIVELKSYKPIQKPIYDFKTHARSGYEILKPAKLIILEGLFALHDSIYREIDVRIFVEADDTIRLFRRIKRDVGERGRTAENIAYQFNQTVLPMHVKYIEPEKKNADYIIINNQQT